MFDPTLPLPNVNITSAVLRGQFNGLKAIIDALPSITAAQVDGVTTLPAGSAASVNVSVSGHTLHFAFGIPQGNEGQQGSDGAQGPPGPPFAQAVVDSVNTLPPGSSASVGVSFDGTNVHFSFGIPQGNNGDTGAQGPPGEVSLSDLNNGLLNNLSQCSNISNGVSTLGFTVSDPPTQGDVQTILNKLDELIAALRR